MLSSELPDAGESDDDFVLVFSADGGEDLDWFLGLVRGLSVCDSRFAEAVSNTSILK